MTTTDRTHWDIHTSDGRCKYPLTCEAEGWHRTTGDTALQEQIARALFRDDREFTRADPEDWGNPSVRSSYLTSAAAVLPFIHAEVKRAQAQAWEEGCDAFRVAYHIDHTDPWAHLRDNPYRTEQNDG